MADGKVVNVMTKTHSQQCPICHRLPKEYKGKRDYDSSVRSWEVINEVCMGQLHFGLRVFDHLLDLACKLAVKNQNSTSYRLQPGEKLVTRKRKRWIQRQFIKKMGLRIGFPNAKGKIIISFVKFCGILWSFQFLEFLFY